MGCLARRLRHLIAEDAQKAGAVVNSDQACQTVQCAPLRPQVSEMADLPVQFPTKFEMVVDFKTAKALCAAIASSVGGNWRSVVMDERQFRITSVNSLCGSPCGRLGGSGGWWFWPRRRPQLGSYLGRTPSELA